MRSAAPVTTAAVYRATPHRSTNKTHPRPAASTNCRSCSPTSYSASLFSSHQLPAPFSLTSLSNSPCLNTTSTTNALPYPHLHLLQCLPVISHSRHLHIKHQLLSLSLSTNVNLVSNPSSRSQVKLQSIIGVASVRNVSEKSPYRPLPLPASFSQRAGTNRALTT